MKTFNENTTLVNFEAWSGAESTKTRIIKEELSEEFDSLIEELYPDGLSETQLNDLLCFESEWIYESLGMTVE